MARASTARTKRSNGRATGKKTKSASSKGAGSKRAKAKSASAKGSWGGRRPGAGRPKGSGQGPSPDSRRNRVAVMLTDTELRTLRNVARKSGIPVSTAAYEIIARSLSRGAR